MKRYLFALTQWERDEILSALEAVRDHGLAYGHIAGAALTRAENRRDALIANLESVKPETVKGERITNV